jgi:NAD(P)-dependent dehydrogenase (short-subunit alcohol dehydrogenase family)
VSVLESFRLDGRTAIVTGAAGLLGQEFVRALAEAGAHVVAADLDEAGAKRIAEAVENGVAAGVDVTSPEAVRSLFEGVRSEFGGVDVLVNSAAMDPKFDAGEAAQHTQTFEDFPLEMWNRALAVNLTGMFLCCQAAARAMQAEGRGSIINICSTYGLVGPDQRIYQRPGQPTRLKPAYYSVSKAGVLGLTRYLATYFAGTNIRVNALTPGGVYHEQDEDFVRAYSSRTVLGRMARKDEMSGALVFLASDASSYMTGANLVVDGGWTAW